MADYKLQKDYQLRQRYRIYRSIGQGGFGITYIAQDEVLQSEVVIKEYFPVFLVSRDAAGRIILPEDEKERVQYDTGKEKFLEEARILASLSEIPGIVKALDYFKENDTAYIVMEYVKGISLRKYLERNSEGFSFAQCCEILLPVISALEKVHKKGLLHRDINPDNIMVLEDGSLKLLDFGSAREYLLNQDLDKTMTVLVKNGYAPPEQYEKKSHQGPWTDIYALCATMYEMMTGCVPEGAKERQVRDELYPPSTYGVEITPEQEEKFLKNGLALSVENRYLNLQKMKLDFYPQIQTKQKHDRKKRNRIIVLGVLTGIIIAAAWGGNAIRQKMTSVEEVYAGNFDRDSREYNDFLNQVKEGAQDVKQREDSVIYYLDETVIKKWGLVSNEYLLDYTNEQILDYLKQQGFHMKLLGNTEDITVTQEAYGVIRTKFNLCDRYQVGDNIRMDLYYDIVSHKVCDLYIYQANSIEGDIAEVVVSLMDYMEAGFEESRDEVLEAFRKDCRYYYEKNQEDTYYAGYYCDKFAAIFMYDNARIPEETVGVNIARYGPEGLMNMPAYNWP